MNEVEKKEIDKMAKIMYGVEAFELEVLAEALYNAGYGKVEDYKKEIERLKETLTMSKCVNCKQFEEMREKLKQQVIKEFADKLKINGIYLPYSEIKVLNIEYIDDLLKEYGIGEDNAD